MMPTIQETVELALTSSSSPSLFQQNYGNKQGENCDNDKNAESDNIDDDEGMIVHHHYGVVFSRSVRASYAILHVAQFPDALVSQHTNTTNIDKQHATTTTCERIINSLEEEDDDEVMEPVLIRLQFVTTDDTIVSLRSYCRRFCKLGDLISIKRRFNKTMNNKNSTTIIPVTESSSDYYLPPEQQEEEQQRIVININSINHLSELVYVHYQRHWSMKKCQIWQKEYIPQQQSSLLLQKPPVHIKQNNTKNSNDGSGKDRASSKDKEENFCLMHNPKGLVKRTQGTYVTNFLIHMIARKIEVMENSNKNHQPMDNNKNNSEDSSTSDNNISILGDPCTWAERNVRTILQRTTQPGGDDISNTERTSDNNNNNNNNNFIPPSNLASNHSQFQPEEREIDNSVKLHSLLRKAIHVLNTTTTKTSTFINNDNCSGGVMDAAGGLGIVSMSLGLAGIRSIVVDPRESVGKLPGRDRKYWNRLLRLQYEQQQQQQQQQLNDQQTTTSTPSNNQQDTFLFCQPVQEQAQKVIALPIQPYVTVRGWLGTPPVGVDTGFRHPDQTVVPVVGIVSSNKNNKNTIGTSDDKGINSPEEHGQILLNNINAIVSLHPDEATDIIVDLSIENHIPFCIVPCCVFSRLFPNRRKPNGDIVSTYDDLLDYLQAKHPTIQRTKLPFPGANTILWSYF